MTARQPFTRLCQQLARRPARAYVDLHIHTTCSDGAYTPAEVIELGRRSGLPALAITDHDTIDALEPACRAAAGAAIEVIPGIEITTQLQGRTLHLLGYFFRPEDRVLTAMLQQLHEKRLIRFREIIARLAKQGVALAPGNGAASGSPGRRHVAELLVKAGHAASIRQAFLRYLADHSPAHVPSPELPVADAIEIVRGAGGVAAWAHPPYYCTRETLADLRRQGLQAVEAAWPTCPRSRARELRAWAADLGLAVTGGSDCHGPGNHLRDIGAHGITVDELDGLRSLAL